MSKLEAFFAENAERIENEFYIASKRFKDESGKPIPWELRPLTEKEIGVLRKRSRKTVKGKGNHTTDELDHEALIHKMAIASVVFPNLKDAALQDSYNAHDEEELIRAMLKAGEYDKLILKVQEVSGYTEDMEDLMEDAKN